MERKRDYPKCFNNNINAVIIYDTLTSNYIEIVKTKECNDFFKLITLLLCAINVYNTDNNIDKIIVRFKRYFHMHYNNDMSYFISLFHLILNKYKLFFKDKIKNENDLNLLLNNYNSLNDWIINGLNTISSNL